MLNSIIIFQFDFYNGSSIRIKRIRKAIHKKVELKEQCLITPAHPLLELPVEASHKIWNDFTLLEQALFLSICKPMEKIFNEILLKPESAHILFNSKVKLSSRIKQLFIIRFVKLKLSFSTSNLSALECKTNLIILNQFNQFTKLNKLSFNFHFNPLVENEIGLTNLLQELQSKIESNQINKLSIRYDGSEENHFDVHNNLLQVIKKFPILSKLTLKPIFCIYDNHVMVNESLAFFFYKLINCIKGHSQIKIKVNFKSYHKYLNECACDLKEPAKSLIIENRVRLLSPLIQNLQALLIQVKT